RRLGVITMVVYLIAGLIGAPVFAGGSGGIGSLTSPSFGFVLGFIPLAYFSGLGNSGGKNTLTAILTTIFGMIILFTIGFLYQILLSVSQSMYFFLHYFQAQRN